MNVKLDNAEKAHLINVADNRERAKLREKEREMEIERERVRQTE